MTSLMDEIKRVTAGATQKSIFGLDLQNGVLYVKLSYDVYLIGYADDIATVTVARDVIDAQTRPNHEKSG